MTIAAVPRAESGREMAIAPFGNYHHCLPALDRSSYALLSTSIPTSAPLQSTPLQFPLQSMTSESIRQRSDLLGTQIITRNTGNRLGIISQVWVDIDRQEIIGFGVKDNILAVSAMPRFMHLDSISQIGDVILVEDERAIEDFVEPDAYNTLIGCETITETGELLGKVRGFKFDVEDGKLVSIIIASIGLPQVPEQVISTYELPIEEVVSTGPDRLIVFEGAEARLIQLSVGVLERLGLSSPPWERDEEDLYFTPTAAPGNQLASGLRTEARSELRQDTRQEIRQEIRQERRYETEAWDEDDWQEPAPRYNQSRRQDYDEADNWDEPQPRREREREYEYEDAYDRYDENVESDAWTDEDDAAYRAPKLEIPEKVRQREPEYEDY